MKNIERLAREAGFKVFGDKIVAADENNSGLATESVKRLVNLLVAQELRGLRRAFEVLKAAHKFDIERAILEEREACARLAMTEAALQHELDSVRSPRAAIMHSPDAAKWQKMATLIRMRSSNEITGGKA